MKVSRMITHSQHNDKTLVAALKVNKTVDFLRILNKMQIRKYPCDDVGWIGILWQGQSPIGAEDLNHVWTRSRALPTFCSIVQAWTAGIEQGFYLCQRLLVLAREGKKRWANRKRRQFRNRRHRAQSKQESLSPWRSRLELDLRAAVWLSPMATAWPSRGQRADWVNSACRTEMFQMIKTWRRVCFRRDSSLITFFFLSRPRSLCVNSLHFSPPLLLPCKQN